MSRQLPQDRGDLEREQLLVQSGKRYEERKTLVKLLRADRRNEDAWVAYVATFSSFEGKLKALTTAIKSLPHSFRLATALRDLRQSMASDSKQNQDGTENLPANEPEFLEVEKTQSAKFKSIQSSVLELPRCDRQHDPNVDPPFRIVKHRATWGSKFRVEGGKDSWLTRRAFYARWHAEVAIEVFKTGGTDDEAFYLQLIRSFSTKKRALDAAKRPDEVAKADRDRVRQEKKADREQRAKARAEKGTTDADNLKRIRREIGAEPQNAELRFNHAIELLRGLPNSEGVSCDRSEFWSSIRSFESSDEALNRDLAAMKILRLPLPKGSRRGRKAREAALEQLSVALALGFTDSLIAAKSRFLVITLSLQAGDLPLLSRKPHRRDYVLKSQQEPVKKRLLPLRALADDIILDTARHLRRDPHDIEAISIQKAAYEFLGDQKGVGKSEQALRQARSMHTAGLRTKTSERLRSASTGTRRKKDGLELEATAKQVLEKLGMEARTTQVTGDGGIDIEAYDTRPIFAGKYIVQCKDWEQPVGDSVVRELFGVAVAAGANKGILISTGSFTKKAHEFAKGKPLELIDGEMLRGLISSLDTK